MGPLLLIVWRCKTDSVIENESVTRFRCSPASTTLSATGKLLSIVYSLLHREDVQNNCKLLRATEESQDNVPIAAATLDYVLFLRQIWSALALLLGAGAVHNPKSRAATKDEDDDYDVDDDNDDVWNNLVNHSP